MGMDKLEYEAVDMEGRERVCVLVDGELVEVEVPDDAEDDTPQ